METDRTARLVLTIQGPTTPTTSYTCRPHPRDAYSWQLYRYLPPRTTCGQEGIYIVRLTRDGQLTCTCPGHVSHNHCKHADAIRACKLLPVQEILDLRGKELQLEQDQAKLAADYGLFRARMAALEASRPPARARARRKDGAAVGARAA